MVTPRVNIPHIEHLGLDVFEVWLKCRIGESLPRCTMLWEVMAVAATCFPWLLC